LSKVTCLIPARNEEGHLETLLADVLQIQSIFEILIVEGNSTDKTWEKAKEIESRNPDIIRVYKQPGKGKFDAVLFGASKASTKSIIIWDADATVSKSESEEMIRLHLSTGAMVIGNRLRGRMEKGSMRLANKLGNWFFAILWVPILNQSPADLLCGTKVFEKNIFSLIPKRYLEGDPFGDFALIATAESHGVQVVSYTVDYASRKYGKTNIRRWSAGVTLLKFTVVIYFELLSKKFYSKNR
jgi:glycosyltransferase involved in cell wall biosynthesis